MPVSASLSEQLKLINQNKLANYIENVQGDGGAMLKEQVSQFDLEQLSEYITTYGSEYQPETPADEIDPAPYFSLQDTSWDRELYQRKGEELISASKVACFTVAGGQGSRLGYDGPKGCYPTSCVSNKSLFEMFAQTIYANERKYGAEIPWYIMTSPLNHTQTISFFEAHNHFGLNPNKIKFFEQGVMPSFDAKTGDILLADPAHLATNPDGHGGAYKALHVSGALEHMIEQGIEQLCYFQVDNPNAKIIDPVFIGLHAFSPESSGEFSSKMVAKASWDEKVGVFCRVGETISVVEYSDLPKELAQMTNEKNELMFNAGSIAIHIISTAFINKIATDPNYALPFHRAVKKVPHFDTETGQRVEPDQPNAIKLERFVFDAIALADRSIVLETDRVEEFAPVKNATGSDSIETSQQLQSQRAANWLVSAGVSVPFNDDGSVNASIELSPLTALCQEDFAGKKLPASIEPGASVTL